MLLLFLSSFKGSEKLHIILVSLLRIESYNFPLWKVIKIQKNKKKEWYNELPCTRLPASAIYQVMACFALTSIYPSEIILKHAAECISFNHK